MYWLWRRQPESITTVRAYEEKDFKLLRRIYQEGGIEPWKTAYYSSWTLRKPLSFLSHLMVPLILWSQYDSSDYALLGGAIYEVILAAYIYSLFAEDRYGKLEADLFSNLQKSQ